MLAVYWLGYFVVFWGCLQLGVGLGLLLGVRLISFLRWFGVCLVVGVGAVCCLLRGGVVYGSVFGFGFGMFAWLVVLVSLVYW